MVESKTIFDKSAPFRLQYSHSLSAFIFARWLGLKGVIFVPFLDSSAKHSSIDSFTLYSALILSSASTFTLASSSAFALSLRSASNFASSVFLIASFVFLIAPSAFALSLRSASNFSLASRLQSLLSIPQGVLVLHKVASVISAFVKIAVSRLALLRFAPLKSESRISAFVKSVFSRFAFLNLILGKKLSLDLMF